MALDNLRGGTKRVVEENTPLNNLRGGTKRVVIVDGGGGGSVDTSKVINADVLPTADASSAGKYYLYTGATTAEYTQNYIYKNVKTATYTGEVDFAFGYESSVTCTASDFANFITSEGGVDPTLVVRGGMTYKGDNLWELVGYNSDGEELFTVREHTEDFQDAGFTFSGTPTVDDALTYDCTITEASATYAWTQVDVQPAGSSYTAGVGIDITNNEISLADTGGMSTPDEPFMLTATEDSSTGEVTTSWSNEYVKSINGNYGDVYLNAENVGAVPQTSSLAEGTDFDPRYKQGLVVQYSGTTDQNYTQGYFYKSVEDPLVTPSVILGTTSVAELTDITISDSTDLLAYCEGQSAQDSHTFSFEYRDGSSWWDADYDAEIGSDLIAIGISYSGEPQDGDSITVEYTAQGWKWEQIDVQPSGGGGSYLPLSGGTLTGDVSLDGQTAILFNGGEQGYIRPSNLVYQTDIGYKDGSSYTNVFSLDFGSGAILPSANASYHKLGSSSFKWGSVYVTKINNGADIAVPTTGGTMAVIGVNTTATLAVAGWSNNEQTVSVTGMTADGVVLVSPTPANQSAYTSAGILCTAQAAGSLTFTCDTVPSADITVTVVML